MSDKIFYNKYLKYPNLNNYHNKYLKYKAKYLKLKEQIGKGLSDDELVPFAKEIYEIQRSLESYFGEKIYLTGSAAVVLLAKKCDTEGEGKRVSMEDYPIPGDADFILDVTGDISLKREGYRYKTINVEGFEYSRESHASTRSDTFINSENNRTINSFDLTCDGVRRYHTYDIGEGKLIKILDISAIIDNYLENSEGVKEEADKLKRGVLLALKDCESIKVEREEEPSRFARSGRSGRSSIMGSLFSSFGIEEESGEASVGAAAAAPVASPVREYGASSGTGRLSFESPPRTSRLTFESPQLSRQLDFGSVTTPSGGVKRKPEDSELEPLSPMSSEKKSRD